MPRTLTIFFPDGETEYWYTERVFKVGDTLNRRGWTWIVTSVAGAGGSTEGAGKHSAVTVARDGGLYAPLSSEPRLM